LPATRLARQTAATANAAPTPAPPTLSASTGEMCTGSEEHDGSGGAQTPMNGDGFGTKKKIQQPAKNKSCTAPGCTTAASARGLCRKHSAIGTCTAPGCITYASARGLCTKHRDT
jgi:hypothetical protein